MKSFFKDLYNQKLVQLERILETEDLFIGDETEAR